MLIRPKAEATGPFVIDRALPRALFRRAAGTLELVMDDQEHKAATFDTVEEAEAFLGDHLDTKDFTDYDWTIMPADDWTIMPAEEATA